MNTPEWMTDEVVEQAGDIICDVLDSHGHNGFDCRPDAGFDLHCAEAFRAALSAVLPDLLRQAKAEAWEEGARTAWERSTPAVNGATYYWRSAGEPANPYRSDLEQGDQP